MNARWCRAPILVVSLAAACGTTPVASGDDGGGDDVGDDGGGDDVGDDAPGGPDGGGPTLTWSAATSLVEGTSAQLLGVASVAGRDAVRWAAAAEVHTALADAVGDWAEGGTLAVEPPLDLAAADRLGGALVMWRTSEDALYAARQSAAGAWSAPTLVETGLLASLRPVRAGLGPQGDAIAAYYKDGWVERRSVGASGDWSASASIGLPYVDGVVPIDATRAHALWGEVDTDRARVRWSSRDAGGWDAPITLDEGGDGRTLPTLVQAVDDAGDLVAVWQLDGRIAARRYASAGATWSSSVELSTRSDEGDLLHLRMVTAADRLGRALVVWTEGGVVIASAFDPTSGTFAAPAPIAGLTGVEGLALAMDDAGAVLVAAASVGERHDVHAVRWSTSAGRWATPELVDSLAASALPPEVAVATSPAGTAVAAWTDHAARAIRVSQLR